MKLRKNVTAAINLRTNKSIITIKFTAFVYDLN